jgi:hypothetical protein
MGVPHANTTIHKDVWLLVTASHDQLQWWGTFYLSRLQGVQRAPLGVGFLIIFKQNRVIDPRRTRGADGSVQTARDPHRVSTLFQLQIDPRSGRAPHQRVP